METPPVNGCFKEYLFSLVFRPEASYCFTSLPHFAFPEFLEFNFKFFTVVRLRIAFDAALAFFSCSNAIV